MVSRPAAAASMARPFLAGTAFALSCLVVLFITSLQAQAGASSKEYYQQAASRRPAASSPSLEDYLPVRSVVYRSVAALPSATVRTEAVGYEPFQLCDDCKCCSASNSSNCVGTRCCYAIDCNLPGKPFGTCAFTPQTCGCGDTNCTQPS